MPDFSKLFLLLTLMAPPAVAADSPIAGTWRGKLHDLPAVVLTVKDEEGKLSGTVLLYHLHRDTGHNVWQLDMKRAVLLPLLNPKVQPLIHPFYGKVGLFFQVSRNEAHPPSTLDDQPVSFLLIPRAKDQADLVNISANEGPALKMVRDEK